MPGRSLPNGARFGVGLSGILRPGRRRIRNLLGPSEAELRANLAGEASADAALAIQEAEAAEAAASLESVEPEITPDLEVLEPPTAPVVPRDLTAAAFFDVDNTMVQGASIIHFARGLAARKYLRTSDLVDFAWKQVKFRITGKENSDDVAEGREKALSFVAGRSTAELARLGEEIYDEVIADKIWAGTRALAQMHLDAGQQVWLVTATPVELAQVIAKRLGLTGALGTVAESEDGVFTGRLVGDILHGLGKAHAVRTLAVREGLNLKRCTAYSDSYNDVPMLSLVGTAVAVNPDADLRELAKNRGWDVRDFRTGRKAAKIGVPTALLLGAVGGAVGAILSRRRERALLAQLVADRAASESGRQPMKMFRRCANSR
ncbi:HAD-IB family hydrolase [Rhodococcus hoagii]|uniref:HAD-IB family hydrolase n=1 Tax=Rhodococcus hoagii TaxID=43767 RepID=A0AAE4ZIA5_RHOHA|nr:HAD-IB family hydrolase [Prescottella equi]GBF16105.1 phosphoserine phosphatase [Rhodococcus sp. Br-6]MBM4475725.1 HAD-IB family hydrolase [Prescottella equi]MBM4477497.1 HAD-IB family hydrolase [Prescottella equi]MBM4599659.1 HAD-IB family hydrolase [Prescottella equi]MBM4692836.1 HAD-IB family hydrolase [Prescottella equi]